MAAANIPAVIIVYEAVEYLMVIGMIVGSPIQRYILLEVRPEPETRQSMLFLQGPP